MLKYRVILGLVFGAIFIGLIWLDSYAAGGWPIAHWSTPPGLLIACVSLLIIPLAIREMQALLAKENVQISMRITVIAALLCMLWPWIEQVGDTIDQQHAVLLTSAPASHSGWYDEVPAPGSTEAQRLQRIESSPWYTVGKWFRSVKPHYLVPTILALSLVAAFIKHSRDRRVDGAMANAGGTLLAIVYLGVLPGFFLPICMTHSAWMMLAIVAVVKSADIGAYATGRLIGKHKLIPWLSPGKTVEGFFGGLAFSAITGAGIAALMKTTGTTPIDYDRWVNISLTLAIIGGTLSGILLGAVGQLGDLLESLLKRDAGVKDSGVVPGFGGVLDILDSPLLAAPVAYWLLKLVLR
ncbi:MAG TPA: phosphatidate cytidylyltransferase [Phycisphaerae bacterium]|jgi:CDP-diglyceride synthetase